MTIKQEARLENWFISEGWTSPYTAPELAEKILCGEVYGDATGRFQDGDVVRTTCIVDADLKERWVQTRNTLYKLGTPSAEWIAWLAANNFQDQIEKFNLAPVQESVSQ